MTALASLVVTIIIVSSHFLGAAALHNYTTRLSEARKQLAGVGIGDLALFAGGRLSPLQIYPNTSSTVDIYNLVEKRWSFAKLSLARCDLAAVSVGQFAMFAGGQDEHLKSTALIDVYDVSQFHWSTASLSQPRSLLAATSLQGVALFAGGEVSRTPGVIVSSDVVDIYRVADNTWSTARLCQPRAALAATSVSHFAIFAGGYAVYDLSSNTWTISNLTVARWGIGVASVYACSEALFAGGFAGILSDRVDIFSATTQQWRTAKLSYGRGQLAAAATDNLAFFTGNYWLESTEIDVYECKTQQWTVSHLSVPRFLFASASIISAKAVMFAGGELNESSRIDSTAVDVFVED